MTETPRPDNPLAPGLHRTRPIDSIDARTGNGSGAIDGQARAELRRVAELVAEDAAAYLRTLPAPRSGVPVLVETKTTPTDVVTASDRAVEDRIRARLAELRPGEPVYGEEAAGHGSAGPAQARWVVDPIDGTVNYLYGLPHYAVSVAAVVDGVSVAGAVVEPASGRVWSAAAGAGATCDGVPLRVTGERELGQALVATGFAYSAERRARQARVIAGLLPRVRDIRRMGASSLDLCNVAAGRLDAYVEHGLSWWDWAAGGLIAAEAGAVLRLPAAPGGVRPDGDELGADVAVVAAPGIARDFLAALHELGAGQV